MSGERVLLVAVVVTAVITVIQFRRLRVIYMALKDETTHYDQSVEIGAKLRLVNERLDALQENTGQLVTLLDAYERRGGCCCHSVEQSAEAAAIGRMFFTINSTYHATNEIMSSLNINEFVLVNGLADALLGTISLVHCVKPADLLGPIHHSVAKCLIPGAFIAFTKFNFKIYVMNSRLLYEKALLADAIDSVGRRVSTARRTGGRGLTQRTCAQQWPHVLSDIRFKSTTWLR